jgi:4-alpha-glucanotransferase
MTTDPWGIALEYEDAFRKRRTPPKATLEAIRRAMGVGPEQAPQPPRARVIRRGETTWDRPGELTLEDGTSLRIEQKLPTDLPLGYHEFHPKDAKDALRLIVSPGVCPLPSARRMWSWAIQLYAARSRQSWGIGDLADLAKIARWSKELGAGVLMINPLHAAAPAFPQETSPYNPTSRCFRNPIYLCIEQVPAAREILPNLDQLARAGQALNDQRLIDRDEVFRLKFAALEQIFDRFTGDQGFDSYQRELGAGLEKFATFCVLAEQFGRDYRQWPAEFQHPNNPGVQAYRQAHAKRVRFHAWLQWLIDEQLQAASRELPIMQDLAVGFDPGGADAWNWQDVLARDMTVGAPSDYHNPWGQNWGLPPFIPHKLAEAGYEPFVKTIRQSLRHAGGLRIDHAMGLFRLFWIPNGAHPDDGTFVNYPAKALLDIVALESHRAGAFVVGEDLGTVQEFMRQELMKHQMLSYRLLWLEDDPPSTYPQRSMAAVTTHDLYTVAGLWNGSDFRNLTKIGLKPDRTAYDVVISRVRKMTDLSPDSDLREVTKAVHRLLAEANSMVIAATLEDSLLVEERPNMPGTTTQWPNWKLALPHPFETIQESALPREIAAILDR